MYFKMQMHIDDNPIYSSSSPGYSKAVAPVDAPLARTRPSNRPRPCIDLAGLGALFGRELRVADNITNACGLQSTLLRSPGSNPLPLPLLLLAVSLDGNMIA